MHCNFYCLIIKIMLYLYQHCNSNSIGDYLNELRVYTQYTWSSPAEHSWYLLAVNLMRTLVRFSDKTIGNHAIVVCNKLWSREWRFWICKNIRGVKNGSIATAIFLKVGQYVCESLPSCFFPLKSACLNQHV